MKIGCPTVKLKMRGAKAKQGKSGSISALLREMYELRRTKSQTYDKKRSYLNEYYYPPGCSNVEEAIEYLENLYESNWKSKYGDKAMRSDRVYGFTGILKPPAKEFMKFPTEVRNQMLTDMLHIYCNIAEDFNITVCGCAVHRDEDGDHLHVYGYSNDFNVHDFSDLPFKAALNRALPEAMRAKGWDFIEDCKRKPGEKKKEHGKDVNTYKRDKIKEETDALEAYRDVLQAQIDNLQDTLEEERRKAYMDAEKEIEAEKKRLKLYKMSLEEQEKKQKENFGKAVREAAEKLNSSGEVRSNKSRQLPEMRGY